MSIDIWEKTESREATVGNNDTIELLYGISGTEDDAVARALVASTAPATFADLSRETYSAKHLGGGVWEASARYTRFGSLTEFSFETGGGTTRVTQSLQTRGAYAPSGSVAPDFGGAIGVNNDSVEGCDKNTPVYKFSETHFVDDAFVTGAYKAILYKLTGRINDDDFRDFEAEEVLLLGVTGNKRGEDQWSLSFSFAASPNASGLSVGDITGIEKKGWDYVWVRYEEAEDGTAFCLTLRPSAVYVEQIYETGDFSQLGIGTT